MVLQHFELKFCRASWVGRHDSVHLELAGFEGLHGWGDMIAFIGNLQVLKDFVGGGGHDSVHLELTGSEGLHGWGGHDRVHWELARFEGLHGFMIRDYFK